MIGKPNPTAAGAIILDYILWLAEEKNHHSNQKETTHVRNPLPEQTAHHTLQLHAGQDRSNGRSKRRRSTNHGRPVLEPKDRAGKPSAQHPTNSNN
jgi:hypothetical protein